MVISSPSSARKLFSAWCAQTARGFLGNSGVTREQMLSQYSEVDNTYIQDEIKLAHGGLKLCYETSLRFALYQIQFAVGS